MQLLPASQEGREKNKPSIKASNGECFSKQIKLNSH